MKDSYLFFTVIILKKTMSIVARLKILIDLLIVNRIYWEN